MIDTNRERLVMMCVAGEITPGVCGADQYIVSRTGEPMLVPMVGGITYNVRIGDPALGWMGDHVEPGVSIWKPKGVEEGLALNVLSCIGNTATVMSGRGKGAVGCVVGDHGLGRVIVDFDPAVLDRLAIGDKVQIVGYGTGLQMPGHPEVHMKAMSPRLFDRMGIEETEEGMLTVPVAGIVPPEILGSGLGFLGAGGDFDLQASDPETLRRHSLEGLRLGDVVALTDCDTSYQNSAREAAITIGVIVHTDSFLAGHGPGVTTIITCSRSGLRPKLHPGANIALYLGLREVLG